MADNDLKVRIGADLSQLTMQLAAGTSVLQKFGLSASKSLDTTSSALNSIKKSGAGIAQSLGSIPAALAAIGDSNAGLQKVNQAIQDSSDKAIKSGKTFQEFGDRVTAAIAQISAGGAGIPAVTAAINQMVAAGLKAGDGFLAIGVSKPLQDIGILRNNVNQLKAELATGFKPIVSIVDPKIPALLNSVSASLTNISPAVNNATAALRVAGLSAQVFADKALLSGQAFGDFASKVTTSISQIKANGQGILQVTAAINDVATAARNAGDGFLAIGLTDPIAEINLLKANVAQLKKELTAGFKPIVSIVDPNTPKLLNSFSASLTNISPAVQAANAALRTVGDSTKTFAVTINKSLADAVRQFDQFRIEATGLSGAFDKIPSSLRPFNTSSLVALRTAVSGLKKDVVLLNSQPLTLPGLARGATEVQKQFQKANPVINSFNQLLREAPAFTYSAQTGILALSNNIPIFLDSFKNARQAGQGFFSILGTLGKSLFSFGSIATIAVSVATIFGDKIFGASKQTKEATDTLEKFKQVFGKAFVGGDIGRAKQEIELYQSSLKSAIESTAQESSKVALIIDRLNEGNTSRAETVALIEQLKKIAPDYFGKLDAEKSKIGDVVTAYDNYNNALVRNIEAQVKVAELTDLIKRRLEAQTASPEATQFIDEQLKAGKTLSQVYGEIANRRSADNKILLDQAKTGKAITDEQLKQTFAVKGSATQIIAILGLRQKEKALLESINNIDTKTLGIDLGDTKKEDAELKSLKDNLEGFRKQLQIINDLRKEGLLPKFREADALKLQEQILQTLSDIDTREVTLKLKPNLEIDKKLSDLQLKKFTDEFGVNIGSEVNIPINANPLIDPDSYFKNLKKIFESTQRITKSFSERLGNLVLPLDITIEATSNVTKAFDNILPPDFNQGTLDKLRLAGQASGQVYSQALTEALREISSQGVGDAFAALGEGIGAALTSGQNPIISAAQGFLGVIGSVLQQIGKEIIIASKLVILLKAALKAAFTNPVTSLIVGIALVAAGAALKNIKFKIPAMAEGGILSGPRLVLAGEAGPEAIIPLDRLDGLLQGGGAQEHFFHAEIAGEKLVLIHDRTVMKQQRRF